MRFLMRSMTALLVISCVMVVAPALSWSGMEEKAGESTTTELLPACGKARVGEQAPWFSGWTLEDQIFNIRKPFTDGDNRRLALVFWATWCSPCRQGLERLSEAAESLDKAGIAVALVNVGESKKEVLKFFKGSEPDFPVVLDPYQNCTASYLLRPDGRLSLPLTALISKDGMIDLLMGAEGNDYIERILAEE